MNKEGSLSIMGAVGLCCFWVLSGSGATVFQDGFESGALGPAWTISGSNDGRCTVTTNFGPAQGSWHLVLDDAVTDTIYSMAQAEFKVNLANRQNAVLKFKAKSLGNEPDSPWWGIAQFDGVSVSFDGGETWRVIQDLSFVNTDWEEFSIPLDIYGPGPGRYGTDTRIRFSEYDNASAPLDGIAIDEVSVEADEARWAALELPNNLLEGSGPYTGYVLLSFVPTNAVVMELSASPSDQLLLPASVEIPAGQTEAAFQFSVRDDDLVNLERNVYVTASVQGQIWGYTRVTILDNEELNVTLTLPAQLKEGEWAQDNATLVLDPPAAVPLDLDLYQTPGSQLNLPYALTIPAGQTQAVFTVTAYDDDWLDGAVAVTVTASGSGIRPATAVTTALDNEAAQLSLGLPSYAVEGLTGNGVVSLSGRVLTNTEVHLTCSDPAALVLPASVVVSEGERQASFAFTVRDNSTREGSRTVGLIATADGFTDTNQPLVIRDNEVAGYRWGGLSDIVQIDRPVAVTLSAADLEGHPLFGPTGPVSLQVVLPDGTTALVNPGIIEISSTGWVGQVTLPSLAAAPLKLRATDTNGIVGESMAFDILRLIDLPAGDLAWDARRDRLYASVPAQTSAGESKVVAIDPFSAQSTGSVIVPQDPGQLALASGGEYLYAALNANGTIARIDPDSLSLGATFALGTSPSDGTFYAFDFCPISGQPESLIVSRRLNSGFSSVAVYDDGIQRSNIFTASYGTFQIEPSSDPNIYFGASTYSYDGLLKLRVDAFGVTNIDSNSSLLPGSAGDMRSEGDDLFFSHGLALDGAGMRRLGQFPANGPVCPNLLANRVFFLESGGLNPWGTYDPARICVYDPATFLLIRALTLPWTAAAPGSFIRWGTNGLAFRTASNIVLVTSSRLVPVGEPANLRATVQAQPNPASVGSPLVYSLSVSNAGPAAARQVVLAARFSDYQLVQSALATQGEVSMSNSVEIISTGPPYYTSQSVTNTLVYLSVSNVPAGASVLLTVSALPLSAGTVSCTAAAASDALDPDFTDNTATRIGSVGFQSALDQVSVLRLGVNNLIYDPTRGLLWATVSATLSRSHGSYVVSINPSNGLVSDPLPISGMPTYNCLALSGNGRFLYGGFTDSPAVWRLDLAASPPTLVNIPLMLGGWEGDGHAGDMEALDGDGTSFLVTISESSSAAVFDGLDRRPDRSGTYSANRIERTAVPGVFMGYCSFISDYPLSRLVVTGSGVTATQTVDELINGTDIRGGGDLLLAASGALVDSSNLTLKANFGVRGNPCLDEPNRRAYLASGARLFAFDTETLLSAGTFDLPVTLTDDPRQTCLRWGLDGFAILGPDGNAYVARWSAIPAHTDSNGNALADAWELSHFGRLGVDPGADPDGDGMANALEYLFGTSPVASSSNPMQTSVAMKNQTPVLRLVFPRRAGLVPLPYRYEFSRDLLSWTKPQGLTETVLASQILNGIRLETVETVLPLADSQIGFLRLVWQPQ